MSATAPTDSKTAFDAPPLRPPTHPAAFVASELLQDSANYQAWVLTLRSRLPAEVIRYLKTGTADVSWPASYVTLWNHYASSSLCAAVDAQSILPGLSTHLDDALSGHKVWESLRLRFGSVSPVVKRLFRNDAIPIDPHLYLQYRDRFQNDYRLLVDSGVTLESLCASHVLNQLPAHFDAWRSTFIAEQGESTALPSLDDIFTRIYRDLKGRPSESPVANIAAPTANIAAPTSNTAPQPRACRWPCPNPSCRQLHWLNDCPDTAWAAAHRARKAANSGTNRGNKSTTPSPKPSTFTACLLSNPSLFDKSSWLLDSGANHHMANATAVFSSLQTISGPSVTGVGGSLPSTGRGSIHIPTTSGPVIVTDALLMPSLPCNLLSVRCLDRRGYCTSFKANRAVITNSVGTVIATAQAVANDLYALDLAPATGTPHALLVNPAKVPLLTLHLRFAHLPIAQIRNMVQKGLVTGVHWTYSEDEIRSFDCNACLASKAHTLPFARSASIAPGRLALVHVDVAHMPRASFGGNRYMLVIIDDYSRKHWCIL